MPAYSIYATTALPRHHDGSPLTRDSLVDSGSQQGVGVESGSWFLTGRDHLRFTDILGDATVRRRLGLVEQGRMIKSRQRDRLHARGGRGGPGGDGGGSGGHAGRGHRGGRRRRDSSWTAGGGKRVPGECPPFVTSGPRSMQVHATWSPRPLEPGDAVFLEVPGCVHRTTPRSPAPPGSGSRRRTPVGGRGRAEALARAKAAMRPGSPAAEAFEAGRRTDRPGNIGYTQGRRSAMRSAPPSRRAGTRGTSSA